MLNTKPAAQFSVRRPGARLQRTVASHTTDLSRSDMLRTSRHDALAPERHLQYEVHFSNTNLLFTGATGTPYRALRWGLWTPLGSGGGQNRNSDNGVISVLASSADTKCKQPGGGACQDAIAAGDRRVRVRSGRAHR
jgi:hypothetical protein